MRIARIEPRVLDHDRRARADDRGVGRAARHRFGVGQGVESQTQGAARSDRNLLGPCRLAVFEIDGDFNLRRIIRRV